MIIDFHTHIFPDSIAAHAVESLKKNAHGEYYPAHDMTAKGLINAMDAAGVDVSVVLPVATKPSHSVKNMEWGKQIRSERIVPFAGLFPDAETWKQNVDTAAEMGYIGIKLHPEYQNFTVGDEKLFPMYDYALSKGLVIVFHAGYDPIGTAPFRSDPAMFRKVVRAMRGGAIVAAHLGGQQQWEEVEDKLVGENIYLDTSMGTEYYGKERFKRILAGHGADKILFATDSPWSDAAAEIKNLGSWDIPSGDLDKIFYLNAKRLLRLR